MKKKWVCQTDETHIFEECTSDGFCPLEPAYHGILLLKDIAESRTSIINTKPSKSSNIPTVFISYSHKDKTYFEIFQENFKSHSRWNIWTDRNIEIGADWYDRIQESILSSDIAILLISANFISSAFIEEHEYKKFSELKLSKPNFIFCPVLLRDVDYSHWEQLSRMQLFVAYGDEYGVSHKRDQLIPFAKLCKFDSNRELIPDDNIDTYFKNLVLKVHKDWVLLQDI